MFGAYFRVIGKNFDVDSFLAKSRIEPDDVFHKGDTMGKLRVRKPRFVKRIWPYSGFSMTINDVFGKLKPQIKGSLLFLQRNKTDLEKLSRNRGVQTMRLVFT